MLNLETGIIGMIVAALLFVWRKYAKSVAKTQQLEVEKEIEETIDTLNIAFEKLLDSIFRDTAWDVSTDISVLHTVLAQEGLTEDDFEKMKQNAEMK